MVRVGTSGYNYPAWRGSFYPARLPAARMLPYYAERLDTVEINASNIVPDFPLCNTSFNLSYSGHDL